MAIPGTIHQLTNVESVRIEVLGGNRAITVEASQIVAWFDRAVREKLGQEELAPRGDHAYEAAKEIWRRWPDLECGRTPQECVDAIAAIIRAGMSFVGKKQ